MNAERMRAAWLAVVVVISLGAPTAADAQVFLATRANPEFTIGPLFVRATVTPALGPVTVDILWSLVIPPTRSALDLEQDIYLLWPGQLTPDHAGQPDPALARYVEARGFSPISEGQVWLLAQSLYSLGRDAPPEPIGGAPFVSFVQRDGLGLSRPASYVRIPWTPKLANRLWLMDLRMRLPGLIKAREARWIEDLFWGYRHRLAIGFNDVRQRAMFPMYFEHRDRVIRLADAPSELVVNFADADHLKIDEVFPGSSSKRRSESLDNTEVVSLFLEKSEGIAPQLLTVQFGYYYGFQSWTPVLIPLLFFVLGNVAGPLFSRVATWGARQLAARVQLRRGNADPHARDSGVVLPREVLSRIVPGETTDEEVVRLCGPNAEHDEDLGDPDHRTLTYRGRRAVPRWQRTFGWLATVSRWDIEHHEVRIELEGNRVRDVQARVRRSRLTDPAGA
jgi:hypothetical protein